VYTGQRYVTYSKVRMRRDHEVRQNRYATLRAKAPLDELSIGDCACRLTFRRILYTDLGKFLTDSSRTAHASQPAATRVASFTSI
jgi:hypothetical protein